MACISLKENDFYLLEYFHDADVMESKCEIKIR